VYPAHCAGNTLVTLKVGGTIWPKSWLLNDCVHYVFLCLAALAICSAIFKHISVENNALPSNHRGLLMIPMQTTRTALLNLTVFEKITLFTLY
jgi:hypothetical protein